MGDRLPGIMSLYPIHVGDALGGISGALMMVGLALDYDHGLLLLCTGW